MPVYNDFYYQGNYAVGFFLDGYPSQPGSYRYSVYRGHDYEALQTAIEADRANGRPIICCYFTKTQTISFTVVSLGLGIITIADFTLKTDD